MTIAYPADAFVPRSSAWQRHGVGLMLAWAAILLVFRVDAVRLATLWWTSTTYGHCLFIVPVLVWLVWIRRAELARMTPVAWWPGLALVALGGTAWLMGDAGTVTFARQLGLVMMLQGAVVTLLGPHVARGLLFPLGYALFLVPFGEGLEPLLQRVTVAMVMPLLHLAQVPAMVDGLLIHAGRYYFEVAEACSGAKFVIAMIAFATLVANVCFVTWRRRMAFMAAALVVPVLANGVRAFATIYAAHLTSVEAATGFDHIVYGWVFFGVVMAAVLAIGWRWFDRAPDDAVFDPAALPEPGRHRLGIAVATPLVIAAAAIFPLWSALATAGAQPLPAHLALPEVAGWHRVPLGTRAPWQPSYPGADHRLFGRYADAAGDRVDLAVAVFAAQREGAKIGAFGTGVLREEDRWVRVADLAPIAGGAAVRITAPGPVERIVVTWYRVGRVLTADQRVVKMAAMKARLSGGPQRAVAIHLSAEIVPNHDPRRAIERFLAALGPLDAAPDDAVSPAIEQVGP